MKIFSVFLFILFSLGSITQAQNTLYTETFANGSLQNAWYAGYDASGDGNNMEVEFQTGNPSGDGWVGKLGNDLSGGNVGEAHSGNQSWTDFYYEANVYVPVNEGTYYGLEFRVDSTENSSGYQLLASFNPNATTKGIRFRARPSAGFPTAIKDWAAGEIPGGIPTTSGWHKFAVQAVGNQFWLYYDDQLLPGCPYTDNTYSNGFIGAYVWDFALSPIYLYIDDITVTDPVTKIDDPNIQIISDYTLNQNYPNPFNPSTIIPFELAQRERVSLTIFNNLGQKVRNLVSQDYSAGAHQVQWNGEDDFGQIVPAGVYYYTIQAGDFQATRKMLIIK